MKAAAAALALFWAAFAAAQPARDAAQLWREMTLADVEAAYRLIAEDHPGALPELGDDAFRARFAEAYRTAQARAERAESFHGYLATLSGFATALGDAHLSFRPLAVPVTVEWVGLLTERRGGNWLVAEEEAAADGEPLRGARLVECDGVAAETLAERRLGGFRVDWSVGAQRTRTAPLLLVDDRNPFLQRPVRCTFERGGDTREVTLRWRPAARSEILRRAGQVVRRGAPGFGVRRSGEGWWIALQSLTDDARPVVEAVRAQAAELQRAPYVVLDMRGNSGGNSAFGTQIAEVLIGSAGLGGGETDACNPVWRVSPRNLAVLEETSRRAARGTDSGSAAFWRDQHRRAVAAQQAGRGLSGPSRCGAATPPASSARPASRFRGRLILLTDHVCFSSCLLVTDGFRRLGALHVGQATDAATHYFEVRDEPLPSGLGRFSTLQAFSPAAPARIGPFEPHRVFEGDISDTAALEAWIAAEAARP